MAANRVDFVDEDDTRRGLFCAIEQVTHARSADADEHLDELGCCDAEEGDAGLAGHGARHQRFTRTGRADEQHAARDARAERNILIRLAQKVDDFHQFAFGRVLPGDIRERDGRFLGVVLLGLRLAEAKDTRRLSLGATRAPDEEGDQQQQRAEIQQENEDWRRFYGFCRDDDIVFAQRLG